MIQRILIAVKEEGKRLDLASCCIQQYSKETQIELVSDRRYLPDPQGADALILDEDMASQIDLAALTGVVLLLSDKQEKVSERLERILTGTSPEDVVKRLGELLELRQTVADLDLPDPETYSENEHAELPKLYLTVSPVGGAGKTTGSLAICQQLALEGRRVLYVNLDPVQDYLFYIHKGNGNELEKGEQLEQLLEKKAGDMAVQLQGEKFFGLKPFLADVFCEDEFWDWMQFEIRESLDLGEYDMILAEIGRNCESRVRRLFSWADAVIAFGKQDELSTYKMKQYGQKWLEQEENVVYICNFYSEERQNFMTDLSVTEYVPDMGTHAENLTFAAQLFTKTAEYLQKNI